jgi:hypothetical protein
LPDLPQGFSKKIKFNLLLADFPFQVTHASSRPSNVFGFSQRL